MELLAPDGVAALLSVTPGNKRQESETDRHNQEMVLKNKCIVGSVSAARKHFETGIYRLTRMESRFPGMLKKLVTNRLTMEQVPSLNFDEIALKAAVDVIPQDRWGDYVKKQEKSLEYSFTV